MYARIIVPLDGSTFAESAVAQARQIAKERSIPIHFVHVIDTSHAQTLPATGMAIDFSHLSTVTQDEVEAKRGYLQRRLEHTRGEGIQATGEILIGPIARRIVGVANPDDVIVMASHGLSGVKRWFLGSVAEDVTRLAPCPVLLHRSEDNLQPLIPELGG